MTAPHGCHNRPPLGRPLVVFDGYRFPAQRLEPITREVPFAMSTDCQYSKSTPADPRCAGCVNHANNNCG